MLDLKGIARDEIPGDINHQRTALPHRAQHSSHSVVPSQPNKLPTTTTFPVCLYCHSSLSQEAEDPPRVISAPGMDL